MFCHTSYDIYVFILCLIVFVLLTGFFALCLSVICKQAIRLIRCGQEDEKIIKEDDAKKNKKNKIIGKVVDYTVTSLLLAVFLFAFLSSLYIGCTQSTYFDNMPTYRVVQTGSMAEIHEKNSYLRELGIDDQIQTFDLIATYKLPAEEDLKLYDIVVYEVDNILLVHRIVGIEPPNESHPDEYYFLLQGDAVESPDRFPVRYSQMRAIYKGERVPFVGSFVMFMQSPAGFLCVLLTIGTTVVTPVLESKLNKEKQKRLAEMRGEN